MLDVLGNQQEHLKLLTAQVLDGEQGKEPVYVVSLHAEKARGHGEKNPIQSVHNVKITIHSKSSDVQSNRLRTKLRYDTRQASCSTSRVQS